jgi:hypothetical protein
LKGSAAASHPRRGLTRHRPLEGGRESDADLTKRLLRNYATEAVRRRREARAGGPQVGFPPGRPCLPASAMRRLPTARHTAHPRARRQVAASAVSWYALWKRRTPSSSGRSTQQAARSTAGSPAHKSPKSTMPQRVAILGEDVGRVQIAVQPDPWPAHPGAATASCQIAWAPSGSGTKPTSVKAASPLPTPSATSLPG